jgi:hypothetical protein
VACVTVTSSFEQRFHVVRLASRATGPTCRLVTGWFIDDNGVEGRVHLWCAGPSSRRRGAGQGGPVVQIGARQGGPVGSAGRSSSMALGRAGRQHQGRWRRAPRRQGRRRRAHGGRDDLVKWLHRCFNGCIVTLMGWPAGPFVYFWGLVTEKWLRLKSAWSSQPVNQLLNRD